MSDDRVFAKCAWRLIPFMMLLFLVNFVDRVNVGFAALTMNRDLGFSPSVFGFGAGVFFLSYCLCGVPANWMLQRIGARRWVFSILAVWGLISVSNAFVQSPTSFYAVRFFLGGAEAGFLPAMLLYLSHWFPQAYLARYMARFQTAIPLSFIVGGPLASLILGMDGLGGLHGWQWLFLLEGIAPFLLAFAVLKFLPDGPARASWLNGKEKETIAKGLAGDSQAEQRVFWAAFRDLRVFALGAILFGNAIGFYGVGLWLPQIVQTFGFPDRVNGFVVALPYLAAVGAMVLWGRSSDVRGERIWHVALPMLLAAAGFASASAAQNYLVVLVALAFSAVGAVTALPPLNCLVKSILSGPAAASGIALFLSIGNLGGFAGPYLIGALKEGSGSYASGMAILSSILVLGASILLPLSRTIARAPAELQPIAHKST